MIPKKLNLNILYDKFTFPIHIPNGTFNVLMKSKQIIQMNSRYFDLYAMYV